ncbi:MAG TPA: hypothetical protein VN914_14475 [Polyangia bacterium]|nr:hypothetical protein [Polyangia bacterium]
MHARRRWLLLIACLGCGTPSRTLTTRIVDDPLVFPRRMLSLALAGEVGQRPRPKFFWNAYPSIRYGVTDRLELDDLLSLRWAVLDDAPPPLGSDRQRNRLSLAVRAGATGVGASTTAGLIVLPVVSAEVAKHLGGQSLLSLTGRWDGLWSENQARFVATDDFGPDSSRRSSLELEAQGLRQLGDHVAVGAGVGIHQLQACTLPACGWTARGGHLWLGPSVRPRRWLTLSLHLFAGARYRPASRQVPSPDEPLPDLDNTVSWLGTWVSAGLQW